MKLRNLRRTLHDDQRLYRKRGRSSNPSGVSITLEVIADGEEESIKEWITSTKRMRPSPENIASIKMGMEKTYTNRRLWITSKSPTVAEVFQQYPRFVDMPYLLDAEFGKMFPGKEDLFLRKWEGHIVPKLLKVATLENDPHVLPAGEESDEFLCFRALQMLTHYLPPTASGRAKGWAKCSVKSALSYILDIKPTGTSIPSLLEGSPEEAVGVHQPKLVCLGHPGQLLSTSSLQRTTMSPSAFKTKDGKGCSPRYLCPKGDCRQGGVSDHNYLLCPKPLTPKKDSSSKEQSTITSGGKKLGLTNKQGEFLAELTPEQREKYKNAFLNRISSTACAKAGEGLQEHPVVMMLMEVTQTLVALLAP
uniref:uncharacterized protein LOC120812847 n=1 Tax=Gasterosteus aculeatus aculeatus TaxID=481459 RepID=UPI001A99371F|nr:uncharacterized protein LOC120812847 [Gasterosteus aculeatus aculeatus]